MADCFSCIRSLAAVFSLSLYLRFFELRFKFLKGLVRKLFSNLRGQMRLPIFLFSFELSSRVIELLDFDVYAEAGCCKWAYDLRCPGNQAIQRLLILRRLTMNNPPQKAARMARSRGKDMIFSPWMAPWSMSAP